MLRTISCLLFDPRGRIDRKGLLLLAGGLFAAQAMIYGMAWAGFYPSRHSLVQLFEVAALWICLAAAVKRLHDIGCGGTWVLIGFGCQCLFALVLVVTAMLTMGQGALETGTSTYWWIVGVTMLPAVAATLWLHVQRGQPHDNIYGPVPGGLGYAPPCRTGPTLPVLDTA
jgi:uncharacterized membrane protein YhaH (DUF805 family)